MDRLPVRDGFFDDDGIGWNDLRELVSNPARVDRLLFLAAQRVLLPTRPARCVTAAPGFGAPRCIAISLGNFFLHGIEQMLQGAFDLAGKDLVDRITPVRQLGAQRIIRKTATLVPGSTFRCRVPGRDYSKQQDNVRFLQELNRFENRVEGMWCGKWCSSKRGFQRPPRRAIRQLD